MQPAIFECTLKEDHTVVITCRGNWSLFAPIPSLEPLHLFLLTHAGLHQLEFAPMGEAAWDSSFIQFALRCHELAVRHDLYFNDQTLPASAQKWLQLVQEPSELKAALKSESVPLPKPVYRLRQFNHAFWNTLRQLSGFMQEVGLAFYELLRGKAKWRWKECLSMMQETGANALPIVSLISFLVGLTMAFVGSIQLSQFGANIYVANLVALAIVREMGAMMTGVILAGRTGAALAASLATMKVTEEIEALKTFGISPITFLVVPRIVAVCAMTPLLCLFSNFVGMLGGLSVGVTVMKLSSAQYIQQTRSAVSLTDFSTGILKSVVFAFLIACIGCLKGLKSGDNAEAVGEAATSAVVSSITSIVIADAILTIFFNIIGI